MSRARVAALLLPAAIVASACTGAAGARPASQPRASYEGAGRAVDPEVAAAARQDRLLVRRASIVVEVEHVARARDAAAALAARLGGHVQRASTASDDRAELVLRVPAPRLDPALDSVARLGTERRREVGAEDVTEMVVDLDARAANLRALRDRLRQHLERATTVADLVAVERELARVQSELDVHEARLKHLRSTVALAELRVELHRRVVLGPMGLLFVGLGKALGKLFVWR